MQTFIGNIKEALDSLGNFFLIKMLGSYLLAAATFLVGADHMVLIGSLSALVAIDLVTGLTAAWKKHVKIESRKAVKTAVKWTLYMLMVSAAHLTETVLPVPWFLVDLTVAFLAVTEFISILENIGTAGVAIPLRLLNRLEEYRDAK